MGDEDTGLGRDFGRLQYSNTGAGSESAATASNNTLIQVFMIVQ